MRFLTICNSQPFLSEESYQPIVVSHTAEKMSQHFKMFPSTVRTVLMWSFGISAWIPVPGYSVCVWNASYTPIWPLPLCKSLPFACMYFWTQYWLIHPCSKPSLLSDLTPQTLYTESWYLHGTSSYAGCIHACNFPSWAGLTSWAWQSFCTWLLSETQYAVHISIEPRV